MKWFKNWFNKRADEAVEEIEACTTEQVVATQIPLAEQFKTITIRGVLVCHSDGTISNKVPLPSLLLHELRCKFSNVGLLVSQWWYSYDWTFNSTVETVGYDYADKEEYLKYADMGAAEGLVIDDLLTEVTYALNKARINGKSELVIHGGPNLIYRLLPYMDILEVYTNGMSGTAHAYPHPYIETINHACQLAKTQKVSINDANIVLTKGFDLACFEYSYFVNTNPLEIPNYE